MNQKENNEINDVGGRIKSLRNLHNVKPIKLARATGVSLEDVIGWENKSIPEWYMLIEIARYFNVSIDWLMTGKESVNLAGPSKNPESELIKVFKSLSIINKKKVISFAEGIIQGYSICYNTDDQRV